MGRHRRSASPSPFPAPPDVSAGRHRGRRRGGGAPVRTGLLGASAAMAMGAVAVASGLLPGGDDYTFGGGPNDSAGRVRADELPDLETQGVPSADPTSGGQAPATGAGDRDERSPGASPSQGSSTDDPAAPSQRQPETWNGKGKGDKGGDDGAGSSREESAPPAEEAPVVPRAPGTEAAAEAEVLTLVNKERAKAGCRPVTADTGLADLAQDFSEDMAGRGFFAHTDPDGSSPWDRAEKLGIKLLGGENIARGQTSAESVMDAWMDSPGHRRNILNCDYKTLGVGAHFADGGPWWTQDFGF